MTIHSGIAESVVLAVSGLSKTFPGVKALDDIDLEIQAGEIHALVGQNGSGKSTLIKVLAGVIEADSGATASVRGARLNVGNSQSAHDCGLRFVHQDLGLIPNLSAVDNLAMGFGYATGGMGRIRWKAQRERARQALARVVEDFPLHTEVSKLTVFEKTALAIARALQDWDEHGALLVLDEPTAAMPRQQVEHLFSLLRRIRDRGMAVMLVTHHLEEVFAIADRVTIFKDGTRVSTRAVSELNPGTVTSLMTGGRTRKLSDKRDRAPGDVALEVSGLTSETLRGVDLTVRVGEIVGVAGLSGSGRDDLCEVIFGASEGRGKVEVAGNELTLGRPDLAIRAGVGLVPAHRHRDGLIMTQSVLRNLSLGGLRSLAPRGRIHARRERAEADRWISTLGVKTPSAEAGVASLSGGNQQKVVVGKWLRLKPKVLLLDEPTQGVDVAAQADLHELLVEAADGGAALLVCSSDEVELSKLCDRVIVLRQGSCALELTGDAVTAHRIVVETLNVETQSAAETPNKPKELAS
ncbi:MULTISPECIES: sugar ABC transporter ATP-binding protein [Actinomycetes]|uniref:sugar ABC transporter ATP-binding protein n=1 Tax=Actinomycetes TaxID=1760 RepID=UPI0018CC2700|nr:MULTISPECIES: sugar ABC transporter ATP-binding protein [Actinomycetes]